MDPTSQVSSLHGVSMLQATQYPIEANIALALLKEPGGANDRALINVAVGAELNLHGDATLVAAQAAREAGNAPNSVLASAVCIVGPQRADRARAATRALIDLLAATGLDSGTDETFDVTQVAATGEARALLVGEAPDAKARAMLAALAGRRTRSAFVRYLESLPGEPTADGVLAAIAATLAWGPLRRKRISRSTAESLPWWLRLFGTAIGASVDAARPKRNVSAGSRRADPRAALAYRDGLPGALRPRAQPAACSRCRRSSASCSPTGRGRSPRRAPRARCRPMGRKPRSGSSSTGDVRIPRIPATRTAATAEGVAFLLERFAGVELKSGDRARRRPARAGARVRP
jgi:hypothetical protein